MVSILFFIIAQQIIPLPGAAPVGVEKVEERGTPALHDRAISNVTRADVTVYLPDPAKATGKALVICPGGGYDHLAIDKEGHDIARWLQSIGYAGIVLKYRLPGSMTGTLGTVPDARRAAAAPVEDAIAAMKLVRANAEKWKLNPKGIGMIGFSAGGNLAALIGITTTEEMRPDFLVLAYPAIPQQLGDLPATMPPTFLVHADNDTLGADGNSVRFYLAMKKAKRPAELHVYLNGGHGFGIRKTDNTSAGWTTALENWLKAI